MPKIETRRDILKFYIVLFFSFVFLFGFGSFMIFMGIDNLQDGRFEAKKDAMPIFGLLLCFLAIWIAYTYYKSSPKITVDESIIEIGNESFFLSEIEEVTLTGKMPFQFIMHFPMEGAAILFKNGTVKVFFDDMYSNLDEVKSFLEQVVVYNDIQEQDTFERVDKNELSFAVDETFKGNQFASFRGITLWVGISFFAYLFVNNLQSYSSTDSFIALVASIGWFALNSWWLHYFELSQNHLVVKNHNFFWKEDIYHFADIKEIVFETQGKQPNCMRLITKDFKSKLYPAGALRDQKWIEMQKALEAKGLIVRNENIYL